MLHDTYTDAIICNSNLAKEFECSAPLQQYSWVVPLNFCKLVSR